MREHHGRRRASACVLLMSALIITLHACASGSRVPPPTAPAVDLSRYTGLWYEIARLPMWAQRKCVSSTAEYRLLDSGDLGVRNACTTESGESISIEGTATVVDPATHAKLNVVFDQWAAKLLAWLKQFNDGNYWILHIDPDYRTAVVGTPDREFLWILARTPTLGEPVYQELVKFSRQRGFDTERLIKSAR